MLKRFAYSALLLLGSIIWGFAFVAQLSVENSNGLGSFGFTGSRFLIGAAVLIPIIFIFGKGEFKDKKRFWYTAGHGAISGIILCVAVSLQQIGVGVLNSSGKSSFITGMYTVLVPIFYFLFFRKKVGINVIVAVVLTLVGIYLLCMTDESFTFGTGELLTFGCAVVFAIQILFIDSCETKITPLVYSFTQFLCCGIIAMIIAFFTESVTFEGMYEVRYALGYTGILSVGGGYTIQVLSQKHVDPTTASIIMSGEALFGALGGILFIEENLGTVAYIGGALMFVGIIISQLDFKAIKAKKKAKSHESEGDIS